MFLYRGKGGGEFEAGQKLTDSEGKEIAINNSSTPAPIDWNGDGKLDLVVGFIGGPAKLLINKGEARFDAPQDLLADGKPIQGQKLGMSVADWDGDKTLDLIVGDESGTVTFYKGAKTATGYTFAAGVPLVDKTLFPDEEDRPGYRTKASVADWDGDGKLDLLVGDVKSTREEPKNLTEAQKARAKKLEADRREISKSLSLAYTDARKKVAKDLGYEPNPDTEKSRVDAFNKAVQAELAKSEAYQDAIKKYRAVNEELAPLQGTSKTEGFVRVYLRK